MKANSERFHSSTLTKHQIAYYNLSALLQLLQNYQKDSHLNQITMRTTLFFSLAAVLVSLVEAVPMDNARDLNIGQSCKPEGGT